MEVCSKCLKRLILWILLSLASITIGLYLDLIRYNTSSFHWTVRAGGLILMILMHYPLKRTGKLLKIFGEAELWGWSTRLITWDIYRCIRHPHHVFIGIFMTGLGLLIGYPVTFLIVAVSQWLWVILFVLLIEEKECLEKFGDAYQEYSRRVPMFLGNPICILRVLRQPIVAPDYQT